jgi:hypothetical protein
MGELGTTLAVTGNRVCQRTAVAQSGIRTLELPNLIRNLYVFIQFLQ